MTQNQIKLMQAAEKKYFMSDPGAKNRDATTLGAEAKSSIYLHNRIIHAWRDGYEAGLASARKREPKP